MNLTQPINSSVSAYSKKYRSALLEVGKSPDTFIYNLRLDFVDPRRHKEATRFLSHVAAIYRSFGPKEQLVYAYDVLQHGRVYRFWHLGSDFRKGEYERIKAKVFGLVEAQA